VKVWDASGLTTAGEREMPTYTVGVDIAAPLARVFAEVADLSRHSMWSADPLEISPLDDRPAGVGKEYHSTATSRKKTISAELKVTEYAPPTRFAFSVHDLTGDYAHEFRLNSDGRMTRVDRTVVATLGLAQRLLYMLVFRSIKLPNTRKAMQRLKELCETPN
jgi:hypothetical protein